LPAAQVNQVVQLGWLLDVVKEPPAQAAQERSVVAEPAFTICVPAAHVVWATQMVAGSPSLSQVPIAHGTAGVAPPWQYSPAVHAVQTASVVDVAAAD
jgi:hypothetical protein